MREKNPDEELMMDFVVLPEDLAQEGEEGMEGDTEIPFIPSWCGHPEKVRQKNLKQKKYLIYFFLQLDPQEGMLRSLCLPQLQVGKSKKIKKTNFFFQFKVPRVRGSFKAGSEYVVGGKPL